MSWIIVKKSRESNIPYQGPSCRRTGVIKGRYYNDYIQAATDASKLTKINPVGFEVKWVEDFPSMN